MKKKVLCTVLSAAMILALAGCGSTDTASTASTAAAEASTEASAEATTEAAQEQTTEASEAASSEAAATGDASDMKIAMITDYGDITDESFNQITYETSKAWAEENGCDFTYYKPEGDSTADRVAMIDKAVADGYNVLVMPGYAFAGAIVETADMYPDVKYVAIDVSQFDFDSESGEDGWTRDNVFSAIYQEELPGYMAGYAAVKLGYKKLGFLGGMAVPAVIRYGYG